VRQAKPFLRRLCAAALGAVAAAGALAAGTADDPSALRARAAALYDEGRLVEARPLLDQLDAAGAADGPSLYRLAYCQRVAGDVPAADATQARARERLEAELAGARDLEVPFYLANTYQNLSQPGEVRRVAAAATERHARGELGAASSAVEQFRLAKLHADLGHDAEAAAAYARSLEAQAAEGRRLPSYERWAARYLANATFLARDFPAAAGYYARLLAAGDAGLADLDRLAVARLRSGLFREAAEAWKQAEVLDAADGDRLRYSQRVALLAADAGALAPAAPSGAAWSSLSREELETVLREQAERVKAAVAEGSATEPPGPERRKELQATIAGARATFAAAAVEYTARGLPLRETAFFGGWAPLLFRKAAWQLPRQGRAPAAQP